MVKLLREIAQSVEKGDSSSLKELTQRALSEKICPEEILNDGLIRGMDEVGIKFKKNEIFIPEVLISTRAMKAGLEILRPHFFTLPQRLKGKIVMGTVKGDLHDIGKKIVCLVLESAGYEVIDIGIDTPKEKFLNVVKKESPDILGMSALLTTTMIYMREVIEILERKNLRQRVKVIIGGGPVTQSFAEEIKADGYAPNAALALSLVERLLKKKRRPE